MNETPLSRKQIGLIALSRLVMGLLVIGLIFFLSAGTLAYWEAWVYLVLLGVIMAVVLLYLLKNDPALLERRLRMRERQKAQQGVIGFGLIVFLVAFVLPGLDYRFGWSQVPAWLEILAFILTFGGYALIIWVLRENSYASRIIEVTEGQKVITGGPYRLVRHPMYLGATVFYVFSPLALGSYVAMIPALLIIPVLAARILNEEKMLRQELPGYPEYTQQTRFRYFPGLW